MVNIWQNYFDEATKKACNPAWNHYDNSEGLTEFFENTVIVDLIKRGEHYKEDYFGLFSHDVEESIPFKSIDNKRFSPHHLEEVIKNHPADAYGFALRRQNENISLQAERYHPGFNDIMDQVLEACGYKLPPKLDHIILFNLMVCSGEFWGDYYHKMLKPAMEALKDIPEAYNDSRYQLIGRPMTPEKEARFIKAFGKPYYPFHPFICERLASIFLQLNRQYTFLQIF